MASIIKRKKAYSVVYNYIDENGETKQKWETWHTHKEALKRKAEVENQINTGTFLPPNNQKVSDFLYDFVSTYGAKQWGVSMYDSQTALIANYINPIIGDMEVQAITPRVVDKYIQTLQKTPPVCKRNRKPKTEFISNQNIEKIIKLLRCAFKQAVRWELIAKNPFENTVLPKTEYKKRDIWDADTIRIALDQCTDSKLYVAMNLAFACSLRMGEILGLTWKNVHIEDENIAADNAYVYIEAELIRASKQAIEMIGEKDIFHIFTPLMPNTSTRLILKKPKTKSSERKVWLPKTVEAGKVGWKEVLEKFYAGFHQEMVDAEAALEGVRIKVPEEETDEVCELCGRKMVIKSGRFGRFLACPGYPECKNTKPLVEHMPGRCPKCGSGMLKRKSAKGYVYYACEKGVECGFMSWDVPTELDCPECGQTLFKKSGRGHMKPFCINEKCVNFLPEDKRG